MKNIFEKYQFCTSQQLKDVLIQCVAQRNDVPSDIVKYLTYKLTGHAKSLQVMLKSQCHLGSGTVCFCFTAILIQVTPLFTIPCTKICYKVNLGIKTNFLFLFHYPDRYPAPRRALTSSAH